jgi:hypothetical protein
MNCYNVKFQHQLRSRFEETFYETEVSCVCVCNEHLFKALIHFLKVFHLFGFYTFNSITKAVNVPRLNPTFTATVDTSQNLRKYLVRGHIKMIRQTTLKTDFHLDFDTGANSSSSLAYQSLLKKDMNMPGTTKKISVTQQ